MTTTAQSRDHAGYAFRRSRYFDKLPPRFEHATVGDVAQGPLLVCPASTPLRSVARSMAANRVHSVIVSDAPGGFEGWGLITDATLVDALGAGRLDAVAGEVAAFPAVTAGMEETLVDAVGLMRRAASTHLLVLDPDTRSPVAVLSALDLAATWAWGLD